MGMERKKAKVTITVRICATTLERIEAMAQAENRTLNNMIETILKRYVNEHAAAGQAQCASAPQADR